MFFLILFLVNGNVPINNPLFVQKFETGNNFGRIEFGSRLRKTAAHLNMKHEITAIQVLHYEKQMTLWRISGKIELLSQLH